ncbi:MAG TPA: serine/threonine-protein kinase [Polyangiaceae bacterium]|nr:serine/threonine-protein kinase [Polyangiaceae bacterium]
MVCPSCHRRYPEGEYVFCPYDGGRLEAALSVDAVPTMPTPAAGQVLAGRYELRGFIGKGAMAHVYLAQDRQTNEPVAVKVLEARVARDARARDRLRREALAATTVGHPNIVRVHEVGERDDGAPFLVMEFLFGESLGALLRREPRLKPDIALPVALQAASALAAAHRAGIVHRDVKPDNIFLVGAPGDPYAVRLLDFGLAKLYAQHALTQAGIVVGTPEYMAPEQVVADESDARTDVYGLGMVLYRMLAGRLPFSADPNTDLLARQLLSPPPPPSAHGAVLPPDLEQLVLTALRKHPENRYSTMDDVVEDIERLLGDRPGAVEPWPLAHRPDVYRPRTKVARQAAAFFYKRLGLTPPSWDA